MKSKKLHITINTRVLLYFLFVTILPLAILALSSTFLINFGLNEKSEEDLLTNVENIQSRYNNIFENYKLIRESDTYLNLNENLINDNTIALYTSVNKLREFYRLSYVVLYDANFQHVFTSSDNRDLFLYPVEKSEEQFKSFLETPKDESLVVSTEIINQKQLSEMKLNNKVLLKVDNTSNSRFGLLSQVGLITIYKKKKNELIQEEIKRQEDSSKETIIEELTPELQEVVGYLLIGNFLNSNDDLKLLLKDFPYAPVNVLQDKYIVAYNPNVAFDVSTLDTKDYDKLLNSKRNAGEHIISGKWFRINTLPINNHLGERVGIIVSGLEEEMFRSLKSKNSLLMLQIAILVAAGGLILAFLFTKSISEPISKMIAVVKKVESGDTSVSLEIPQEDELGDLAKSINQMTLALEQRKQQILEYNKLLIDQKTKLETIFNYSADGIITVDSEKRIKSVNPMIIKWSNTEEENILGQKFYEIINYSTDPVSYKEKIKNIEDIDDLTNIAEFYPNAKLNDVELEISYSLIKLDEETLPGYVFVLRDITKRRETEELRSNFIATLTHDLRTPLIAGVHTLEYLLRGSYGELDEKQQYIVKQLIKSNEDLLRMVNTLLDTYSYESGTQNLIKREINLNKLIAESIEELKHLAIDKKQKVVLEDDGKTYFVIADKQETKRVLINLLSNAITHTQLDGEIVFSIFKKDQKAVVSVKDNGVGLSERDKERIFNRFVKGGKTLRKIGTGLGLYLSKHIVEAQGGKMWVESELTKGSCFYFDIPLSKKGLELQDE